ncbi:MAG: tRNA preQ1(34) S-adenosylmethionine ribosyltransferase-isomerase QueA [Betaproteobacteria bacterium]|nr:MAG: tRNA preQ1(34) S-adenosylmethionine ribosyltransferase-isomerase QueA [Betaproteobacteria bacterium]
MHLDDFNYELPQELIAQTPPAERGAGRLLHVDGRTGAFTDRQFRDILGLVGPDDVLVFNDTRVIKARLRGRKATGGRVEVIIERILGPAEVLAQIGSNRPPRAGTTLVLADALAVTVLGRDREFFHLRFEDCSDIFALLERHGSVPLPLYITRPSDAADAERYQTVYSRSPGAVAAPTAGLHFDTEVMRLLQERGTRLAYLTLHVGAGTFQPVRSQDLSQHVMHSEWYEVPQASVEAITAARERGGRVLAIGTTTLRALESAAATGTLTAGLGETRLFILPGFRFRVVERLLTNFHLPRSTLLMLVSAFGGMDNIRRAYRHAIDQRYRFYSYGDAMLIERQDL